MSTALARKILHKEFAPRAWVEPTSLAEIETALDSGRLYVAVGNGRWWVARRNGVTKRWVTRPLDYRIPIKYGFRGTGRIENTNWFGQLRIADSREDAEHA